MPLSKPVFLPACQAHSSQPAPNNTPETKPNDPQGRSNSENFKTTAHPPKSRNFFLSKNRSPSHSTSKLYVSAGPQRSRPEPVLFQVLSIYRPRVRSALGEEPSITAQRRPKRPRWRGEDERLSFCLNTTTSWEAFRHRVATFSSCSVVFRQKNFSCGCQISTFTVWSYSSWKNPPWSNLSNTSRKDFSSVVLFFLRFPQPMLSNPECISASPRGERRCRKCVNSKIRRFPFWWIFFVLHDDRRLKGIQSLSFSSSVRIKKTNLCVVENHFGWCLSPPSIMLRNACKC